MTKSYVITGGGRGVGRPIVDWLAAQGSAVVIIDMDEAALDWVPGHPAARKLDCVTGSAADRSVAATVADRAAALGRLSGWVNNAAVFRDAQLHAADPAVVMDMISANLAPVSTGCAVAMDCFRSTGHGGAIVNVSSHQAKRAVRGALPYATAKAAIEGLTRAAAIDYGPNQIRVNAVVLGSIDTERYRSLLQRQNAETSAGIRRQMAE